MSVLHSLMTPRSAMEPEPPHSPLRRRLRKILVLAAILFPAGITVSAEAQQPVAETPGAMTCNTRDVLTAELKAEFAETPMGLGMTAAGTVLELWKSRGGDTWTLLLTMPDGKSCIVGSGKHWMVSRTDPAAGSF